MWGDAAFEIGWIIRTVEMNQETAFANERARRNSVQGIMEQRSCPG